MSDQEPNRSEKRLQDIEGRIAKMQGDRDDAARPSRAALPVGMGAILRRVATELVAGVMVGAGVAVGAGVGAGAGGLLMMTLPPVPGEAISSAPQAASAMAEQPRIRKRERLVTASGPLKKPRIEKRSEAKCDVARRRLGGPNDTLATM